MILYAQSGHRVPPETKAPPEREVFPGRLRSGRILLDDGGCNGSAPGEPVAAPSTNLRAEQEAAHVA
jgi:hypothetical protein